MATTLINSSGFVSGIPSAESGVGIKTIKMKFAPEFRTFREDETGAKVGIAIGPVELTVDLDGEVGGSSGLMAATFFTATTLTNSTAYFGAPATGLYMVTAGIDLDRTSGAWQMFAMSLTANAGIP